MAEQIIDFEASNKAWQDTRRHLHTVESMVRMIMGHVSSEQNGTELADDIHLVGAAALREIRESDEHLDEIEKTLVACRHKISGE